MASVIVRVTGMTCDHCRTKVEQALKAVPGVYGAAVFLEEGEAEVAFDRDTAVLDQIVQAVRTAGYDAELAEAQERE